MSRTSYPAGPAFLTAGGITIEMAEDWKSHSQIMKADMKTNLHGIVGSSEEHVITKITGKPIAMSGNLADLIAFLFPYTPDMIGQLVMPDSDSPAIIQTRDGKSITYAASCISKMPEVNLAANVDIFGDFELTCLRAVGADPTSAADVAHVQPSAFAAPSLDPLTRIRSPYTVAWGSTAPFDAIETSKAGVKFSPSVKLSPVEPDLTRQTGIFVALRLAPTGACLIRRLRPARQRQRGGGHDSGGARTAARRPKHQGRRPHADDPAGRARRGTAGI